MKTYRDFIQDLLREEPERTVAYKAMQKTLYPRGGTTWKGKETATLTNVGGFKSRRDKKSKRNRGYGAMKSRLMAKSIKEDAPTMSAGNGGFSSNPENPANQGYDPLMKMMNRWKKAKTYPNKMADVVNRGKNGR